MYVAVMSFSANTLVTSSKGFLQDHLLDCLINEGYTISVVVDSEQASRVI